MRYLGIDLGSKTVGLAMSDTTLTIASTYKTIFFKDEDYNSTINEIKDIIKENNITKIILGLPKNMNNTEGERCEKTKEFAQMLERRTGLSVVLWDERLTTVAAEQTLIESGVRRENRKQYVDKIAAVFILQGYLDSIYMQKTAE